MGSVTLCHDYLPCSWGKWGTIYVELLLWLWCAEMCWTWKLLSQVYSHQGRPLVANDATSHFFLSSQLPGKHSCLPPCTNDHSIGLLQRPVLLQRHFILEWNLTVHANTSLVSQLTCYFLQTELFWHSSGYAEKEILCSSAAKINPGFGHGECQVNGATGGRVNSKSKDIFRSKRKLATQGQQQTQCYLQFTPQRFLSLSDDICCSLILQKWISNLITKFTQKPKGKFVNSKCCSEGSICVVGEADCNPPWYEMSRSLLLTNKPDFFTDFPLVSAGDSMQAVSVQHSPQPAAPFWEQTGSRRAKRHSRAALPCPQHRVRWRNMQHTGGVPRLWAAAEKWIERITQCTGSRPVYPLKGQIFSKIWDLEECKSIQGASK